MKALCKVVVNQVFVYIKSAVMDNPLQIYVVALHCQIVEVSSAKVSCVFVTRSNVPWPKGHGELRQM